MGTWKLNAAKSKFAPGATKNNTVVYQAAFFKVKVTVDGTDAKGKPMHNEWTGNFDGKDYPVTGDPTSDMRSYTKVDDRTLTFTAKKGGKVMITGRILWQPMARAAPSSRREPVRRAKSSKTSRSTTRRKSIFPEGRLAEAQKE